MSEDNKELNQVQLEKVTGGDELDDMVRASLKEQEERKLRALLENVDNNSEQRASGELDDLVNNMIDILKDMAGQDDSDGQIHVG